MQTITIDILNQKAVKLLQDLEQLQLIRMRKESTSSVNQTKKMANYKGAMTKQSLKEIDNQVKELRNGWE